MGSISATGASRLKDASDRPPVVKGRRRFSPWAWVAAPIAGLALLFSAPAVAESECAKILSAEDLSCRAGRCPGPVDAGDGVIFELAPGLAERKLLGPPTAWMSMTVLDRGSPVQRLPDSFYIGYTCLSMGEARYWMIGQYTGGMHCCVRYHFFAHPGPKQPLHYIGMTSGSSQGLEEEPFSCRKGLLYLEDWDARFLYFHIPYARSTLVFPTHYRLTPSSLSVDNIPFRDKYHRLIMTLDADAADASLKRGARPSALLLDVDGEGFFSDELGQILVKRTILYLFAREEEKAWGTLEADVNKYYRDTNGIKEMKREIEKALSESPY